MSNTHSNPELSIVIPVFNEAAGLSSFYEDLRSVVGTLNMSYELIFVEDGSNDQSATILKDLRKADQHVTPIFLSRNFGKEQATTAGLHVARGKAVIVLDADGQHPVELIPDFIAKWKSGSQVVVGVRTANKKEGFVKRGGSKLFYKALKILGVPDVVPSSTDFRLIDRQVVDEFKKLSEHNRVTRALIDWLGFKRDYLYFVAKERAHGEATYSTKKLLQLAVNGFVSLSFTPLYLSGYVGVAIMLFSFVAGLFTVIEQYILGDPLNINITGTAFLAILLMFLVGILLIGQGLLAIYVARIYTEVQNRPLYITNPE